MNAPDGVGRWDDIHARVFGRLHRTAAEGSGLAPVAIVALGASLVRA